MYDNILTQDRYAKIIICNFILTYEMFLVTSMTFGAARSRHSRFAVLMVSKSQNNNYDVINIKMSLCRRNGDVII